VQTDQEAFHDLLGGELKPLQLGDGFVSENLSFIHNV
jgi:hypothetical protein